jgi:hypothetical protein
MIDICKIMVQYTWLVLVEYLMQGILYRIIVLH